MAIHLRDAEARERIRHDLDRNLVVQAGAGAGKTHALIGRMVEVVKSGLEEIQHLAAITFTKKAAGEMRARLHDALRSELASTPENSPEYGRLRQAIDHVDLCYIGTIHAFCARLLRERPLEAGLTPEFSELDERAEWVSHREGWNAFVLDRYAEQDGRLDQFDSWGIRTDEFFDFFIRRSQFTDLNLHWTDVPPASLEEPARILRDWIESILPWMPEPLVEQPDLLQEALLKADSFLRNQSLERERDQRYLLSLFDLSSNAVTLRRWSPHQERAREIRDNALPELLETVVRPALDRWRFYIYADVAGFIDEAVQAHRQRRFDAGHLTFQDLLEQAAALLSRSRDLRADFQNRYRRLFVDEFQDTDPLQAEILLYLTAQDADVSDWRDCRPRPGSLFLVGDEKQAIYRFRRADLDVFRDVRDRVRASGGEVLDLTTNFRSLGGICDWINTAFEPILGAFDARYQAVFSPLSPYREAAALPSQVVRASIPKVGGNNRSAIAREDADRIARYIGAALSDHDSIAGCKLDGLISPGDFMILTRTTGHLDTYARALENLGIPFSIEGSGKLGESEELHDLIELLETVLSPENPIPLIGYLRGRLNGIGDDELYEYRTLGGEFDYRADIPPGLPTGTGERFRRAFAHLKQAERWLQVDQASVALERVLDALGLLPYAALRPTGSSRAGNLVRLLAIIRRWELEGWNWIECLRELQDLRDDPNYKLEEMTLDSGSGDSVRLMNLHQAKGLQARVVFLADPYDTSYERHDPDFHVSRSGSEPRLTLPVYRARGAHGRELISAPHGWDQDAKEEARFLQAEERRLVYVAATRAEDLLVVSRYEGNLKKGPWKELYPHLEDVSELPEGLCDRPRPFESESPDFVAVEHELEAKWSQARRRSYNTSTITRDDDAKIVFVEHEEGARPGRGTEYGLLVHDLFERAIVGNLPDETEQYVSSWFEMEGQDQGDVEAATLALGRLLASDLWKEIQESRSVHTEVDFAKTENFLGQDTVTRGRIDLVYRIMGGWKIVDYKTDQATSPVEAEMLRKRYGDQIVAYARHWTELSGERVRAAGIWATDPGVWIEV